MSTPRTLLAALACAPFFLFFPGCAKPVPTSHGASGINATYAGRVLRADLPSGTRVPSVAAAAENAMRDRGYTIVRSETTEDNALIVGRPPRYSTGMEMVVTIATRGEGAEITLRYGTFGERSTSAAMLDAILARLGL